MSIYCKDSIHKALDMMFFFCFFTLALCGNVITPFETYSTKAWSLSSTSSSPSSSSDISLLYLEALFDTLSLCTWLCPIHALLASLLANLQPLMEAGEMTDRAPSLERRERTWRRRAIEPISLVSFFCFCFTTEEVHTVGYKLTDIKTRLAVKTAHYFTTEEPYSP